MQPLSEEVSHGDAVESTFGHAWRSDKDTDRSTREFRLPNLSDILSRRDSAEETSAKTCWRQFVPMHNRRLHGELLVEKSAQSSSSKSTSSRNAQEKGITTGSTVPPAAHRKPKTLQSRRWDTKLCHPVTRSPCSSHRQPLNAIFPTVCDEWTPPFECSEQQWSNEEGPFGKLKICMCSKFDYN